MKKNSQEMVQEQGRTFKLWTWMTLLAVVGAYLGTWLFLLIIKAVHA